jgi:hypothetical protein
MFKFDHGKSLHETPETVDAPVGSHLEAYGHGVKVSLTARFSDMIWTHGGMGQQVRLVSN